MSCYAVWLQFVYSGQNYKNRRRRPGGGDINNHLDSTYNSLAAAEQDVQRAQVENDAKKDA